MLGMETYAMKRIGRLHILTDIVLQSRFSHIDVAELAIAGGADTIQFRQKSGSARAMIDVVQKIKSLCTNGSVTCIVNDRVDIALAAKSDGVHLGQEDFPIPLAKNLLGKGAIIGGSASTIEEAQKCFSDGADYIGFGPVFPTTSKEDANPVSGIEMLKKVVSTIPLPIIAIGGVDSKNARDVIDAGAHGIAVISAVCCQQDPKKATQMLFKAIRGSNPGE
jgi:thiamine-phosphate pyrophosphorylase